MTEETARRFRRIDIEHQRVVQCVSIKSTCRSTSTHSTVSAAATGSEVQGLQSLYRRGNLLALLVLCVGVLLLGFPLADRRQELYEMRRRQVVAARRLRRLQDQRARLLDERKRLLTEPSAIERVAREHYGFVAPGESPIRMDLGADREADEKPVRVPSDGWDWILGRGGYPWRLPLFVFTLGSFLLVAFGLICQINRGSEDSS